MQNAFGGRIDDYTSGSETRDIYLVDYGTNQTYSKAYLETRLNNSTLNIGTALYWAWDLNTNVGSSNPPTSSSNMTISQSISVNFVAYNGGLEWKQVLIIQGVNIGSISLVRPSLYRPVWWTDNNYPYFFMGQNITGSSQFTSWVSTGGSGLSPFGNTSYILRLINLQGVDPFNRRQIVTSVQLQNGSGTNQGWVGQFSAIIGQCAGNATSPLDPIEVIPGVNEWDILHNTIGGLCLRVV
jgi:hypothetical protein